MRKKVICMMSLLTMLGVSPVLAMEDIKEHVPNAQKVGEARLTMMLWDVYDATLIAPNGKWSADKPFALQLTYLRHLDGEKIADRTIKEMRKQGFQDEIKLATWHTQMRQIFPDVYEGDILSGISTKTGTSIFLKNGEQIGQVNDPQFSKTFFAIWLSPETSAPDLRLGLLGQNTMEGYNHEKFERTGSDGTHGIN